MHRLASVGCCLPAQHEKAREGLQERATCRACKQAGVGCSAYAYGAQPMMQVDQPAQAPFLQNPISAPWLCRRVIELADCKSSGMADQQALREFVDQYAAELNDLTFNSKALVNTLTMLAGDNVEAASSIAAAIEKHILTVRMRAQTPGGIHKKDSFMAGPQRRSVCATHACLPCSVHHPTSSTLCIWWTALRKTLGRHTPPCSPATCRRSLAGPPACLSIKAHSKILWQEHGSSVMHCGRLPITFQGK